MVNQHSLTHYREPLVLPAPSAAYSTACLSTFSPSQCLVPLTILRSVLSSQTFTDGERAAQEDKNLHLPACNSTFSKTCSREQGQEGLLEDIQSYLRPGGHRSVATWGGQRNLELLTP